MAGALAADAVGDVFIGVSGHWESSFGPHPSAADAFYVVFHMLAVAGLAVMVRIRTRRSWGSLLDSVIIALAALLATWPFLVTPALRNPSTSVWDEVLVIGTLCSRPSW